MIIIDSSLPEITTTLGLGSTTVDSFGVDKDELATTIATTATTMTVNGTDIDTDKVIITDTITYVESLSDEQLENLTMQLEQKELEIINLEKETTSQKIYKK